MIGCHTTPTTYSSVLEFNVNIIIAMEGTHTTKYNIFHGSVSTRVKCITNLMSFSYRIRHTQSGVDHIPEYKILHVIVRSNSYRSSPIGIITYQGYSLKVLNIYK